MALISLNPFQRENIHTHTQEKPYHTQKVKHYYSLYKFIKIEIVVLGIKNFVLIRFAIIHYYFLQDVLIDTRFFHYLNKTHDWNLVVLHTTPAMFGKFWGMLGGCVEAGTKNILYRFIEVKLTLECLEVLNGVWPSMN